MLLMGVTAAAVLLLGRIRSRSKLIYVGLFAGAVARALRRSASACSTSQPLIAGTAERRRSATALWAMVAGLLMTGPAAVHRDACSAC